MSKGMLAEKLGMTRVFDENGKQVPVTILSCGPCYVAAVKTSEKDGYSAVQLAFKETREKLLTKAERNHLKKSGLPAFRHLAEYRDFSDNVQPGQKLTVSMFEVGEMVKVVGRSKGKGFQGVVKRHGFGGGRMTHGSKFHRAPGSMGPGTDPGKVIKGKRLPGQTGARQVTVRNLKIVGIDEANNLLYVKGAVPGPRKAVLSIEVLK
jgi:large subunit ribosomal protein L3